CHNKISSSAAMANCSSQMTPDFQFLTWGDACGSRERISHAKPAAAASTRMARIHFGQAPSRTKSPFEKTVRGYLKRNSNISGAPADGVAARNSTSMRYSIHDVIDAYPKSQRGELLRIARIVSPFPGIAEVHVVANGHHDAALVVTDRAPFPDVAILFVGPARAYVLFTWHLETLAQIIEHVKNLVFVIHVFNGAIRENHEH